MESCYDIFRDHVLFEHWLEDRSALRSLDGSRLQVFSLTRVEHSLSGIGQRSCTVMIYHFICTPSRTRMQIFLKRFTQSLSNSLGQPRCET